MSITATLIAQMIVFLLLVGFTYKFVWPPIAKALDERALKIRDGLAAADQAKAELATANKKVDEQLAKTRDESGKLLADAEKRAADMEARLARLGADIEAFRVQAKGEMEQEGKRILAETAAQAKKLEAQAAAEIENAGKVARAALKQYAADLSLDLAAQRIQGRLDSNTEAGLVDNFLADLKQQGSKN